MAKKDWVTCLRSFDKDKGMWKVWGCLGALNKEGVIVYLDNPRYGFTKVKKMFILPIVLSQQLIATINTAYNRATQGFFQSSLHK